MGSRRIGIIFLASVLLAFFAGFQVQTFLVKNEPEPFLDVYSEITQALDAYYYYDLEPDEKNAAFLAQMVSIVESYARSNNDPYTRLSAVPLNTAPTNAESYIGLGITIQSEGQNLRVQDVLLEGPSFQKLYPNDLIVGIKKDGEKIYFDALDSKVPSTNYLTGKLNEIKTLIVLHPDQTEHTVELTYQEILTPTAKGNILESGLAYLKIKEFSSYIENVTEGTAKVFSDELRQLEESTLKTTTDTLILDLRDNPGGALTALHNKSNTGYIPGITQQLLVNSVEKPLFSMINKNDIRQDYYGGQLKPKAYDIKVLVNENSASAAEVLAAALSTAGGYQLYGSPTYGKSVYQNTALLRTIASVGYYLTYTEGSWLYDGDKKVSDFPLDVELISQGGYYLIETIYYYKDLKLDEVSQVIGLYQKFLNTYFELEDVAKMREDGYFDQKTEDYLYQFQQQQSLSLTKIMDKQTVNRMFDLLKTYKSDQSYDIQLNRLIDIIRA